LAWAKAEAEEIIRLILSGTIVLIFHTLVPQDRWTSNEIVYYNPVVKQKRNDDGTIQFRVRGTAGRNLLNVPYDVSARTASLDTVKLLIHSDISGNYSWMSGLICRLVGGCTCTYLCRSIRIGYKAGELDCICPAMILVGILS
jgi:hypothetical protein